MLQCPLVQWFIAPMIHWSDASLVLQIGAQVIHGPLVLRPDGRSIVRRFVGPTSALNFPWIWKRTHCNHKFKFPEYSKYYRYYLWGEMFVFLLLFLLVCLSVFVSFCFYNEKYTLNERYFTISTDSHLCCVDIQFEGIDLILLIITITHITQLNFCGQNTYTWGSTLPWLVVFIWLCLCYRTTTLKHNTRQNKNISLFHKSHMRN